MQHHFLTVTWNKIMQYFLPRCKEVYLCCNQRVRPEVKYTIIRDVAKCGLIKVYRRFGEIYSVHLQVEVYAKNVNQDEASNGSCW